MSFSHQIKEEILLKELNQEQALSFLAGIISASGVIKGRIIIIKLNREDISNYVREIFEQLEISFNNSPLNKNWILIKANDIPKFDGKLPGNYFAGVFVGGGSISNPLSTSYHLELQLYERKEANFIKNFLNKYNFEFQSIRRRINWVLYIKKSESISDFLKAIEAINAMMDFEDARITRDFRNNLNRFSNLEIYNQEKLAKTAHEYDKMYQLVLDHKLQNKFRDIELLFYKFKRENVENSLSDLVILLKEKHNINKTRSALNHWLIKLRKVIESHNFK